MMKPSQQGSPLLRRKSSTPHYQTFGGIAPPKSRGRPLSDSSNSSSHDHHSDNGHHHESSPLPKKQMAVLAIIALCEQTALNSISPYLPDMASTFPEVKAGQVGVYVGLIASAFALAQLTTNFFWGWLSDRIGRKPVILLGTLFTAACFVAFGFCRTLWQAILVQALMGLLNGNQGVVSTCLGEITDRSNQSKAFVYLPVIYGIGGITGPLIGGVLVSQTNPFNKSEPNPYPYLLPNLLSAAVLCVDLVVTAIFLEESLEEAQYMAPLGTRVKHIFTRLWQFTSSSRPSYLRRKFKGRQQQNPGSAPSDASDDGADDANHEDTNFFAATEELQSKDVLNRDTILLLITYLIFQLSNISFNSLYPIFAQADPPTGRNLDPEEIGLSLAFAGLVTIVFQVGVFGKLRDKMGNRWAYRAGLAGFVVAYLLMPWVGYKGRKGEPALSSGSIWLWIEICVVLLIKTVAAVGGLTSALLLITNSAPNHSVLGTLNGLAQTLSAAGRAVGPFLSGGLFSLATKVRPKGEALAFGLFGGIAFIGFLLSFGIRSPNLEAEGWESGDDADDDSDKSEDEEG
ncbi:major facilitator superfamily domain-containing protein [Exophiala viscosa]|nr:major facilitator superfamily domain-containing protein [Exophiala viscosa]